MKTATEIGMKIGKGIARDVIADGLPREWTGLDPQDADLIPEGMDSDEVERIAEEVYLAEITQ
jgi:hypothetical protein